MSVLDISKSYPDLLTVTDGLSNTELERLNSMCSTVTLEPQTYLFHQHSAAEHCYIVTDGELMIERSSSSGRRQILAFICAGNFIGFTHGNFFEFGVKTLNTATLTKAPLDKFMAMTNEVPQLKRNTELISGNVLAHTLDQVFALGQKKAHERVCFFLNQLMARQGNSPRQIKLTMIRQDIADYLGLTIETVSRAFARLKKDGIIDIHSAHFIEVLDLDAVEGMAISE